MLNHAEPPIRQIQFLPDLPGTYQVTGERLGPGDRWDLSVSFYGTVDIMPNIAPVVDSYYSPIKLLLL